MDQNWEWIDLIKKCNSYQLLLNYNSVQDDNLLPDNQKVILYWTYGPNEKEFDVYAKNIGFRVLGVFPSKESAWKYLSRLTEKHPFLIAIGIRCHELNKNVDFTSKTIYNSANHPLSIDGDNIIKEYLQKRKEEAKKVEDKKIYLGFKADI